MFNLLPTNTKASLTPGFLIAVVLAMVGGHGCSMRPFVHDDCTNNKECQEAFGYGMVCGNSGYCEATQAMERCVLSNGEQDPWPLSQNESVLIGSVFNMDNETHLARSQSVSLAVEQARDNGGFGGLNVLVLACTNSESASLDDLTTTQATQKISQWLADEVGVPAIVGPSASGHTETAYNAAAAYGTLVMSPAATSITLTNLDGLTSTEEDPGLLWRTAAPDSHQAEVIAQDILNRGHDSLAVIYQVGAYGEGLASIVQQRYSDLGGSTSLYSFGTTAARDSAVAVVGTVTDIQEVLFISSDPDDIIAFLNSAALLDGYAERALFLPDSAANEDVLIGASGAYDIFPNIRGTVPVPPEGLVYDTYLTSYAGAFGGQSVEFQTYTANSYDAAWLVLYGMAWSAAQEGEISGYGIGRGLRRMSGGALVEVRASNWNTVRAYFASGEAINVEGASGSLDYDVELGETTSAVGIWVVNESGSGYDIIERLDP